MAGLKVKLHVIRDAYSENWGAIPIWIVGGTHLQVGPATQKRIPSDWHNVVYPIEWSIWGRCFSEAYTLSALGFSPNLITALSKPTSRVINVKHHTESQAKDWNKRWAREIKIHYQSLPGRCPTSMYLPIEKGRAHVLDPGCLADLTWDHISEKMASAKGPGLFILNAYFSTLLHKNLRKALKSLADNGWIICVDFGRLDRKGDRLNDESVPEAVEVFRRNLGLIDIHCTSRHDLVELLHENISLAPDLSNDSPEAGKAVFNWLDHPSTPAPQAIVAKTTHQDRTLWLKAGRKPAQSDFPYSGMDPGFGWYPNFGGIFCGAFVASLLTSSPELDLQSRCEEATWMGLGALSHAAEQHLQDRNQSERRLPLESVLEICKRLEEERQTISPIQHLRQYGMTPSLLGFRSCPEVTTSILLALVTRLSVLIIGETGTGKDFLARYIHEHCTDVNGGLEVFAARQNQNDMGATALCGAYRGSYTMAPEQGSTGLIERAGCGTLLLDDIQELDEATRAVLLYCTDPQRGERFIEPVGTVPRGERPLKIPVKVRFISTTNVDLSDKPGWDQLFARLGQIKIVLPPLRNRVEEIPPLAEYFLASYAPDIEFGEGVMDVLRSYSWPKNVRELESAVQVAAAKCRHGGRKVIQKWDLPDEVHSGSVHEHSTRPRIPQELWDQLRSEEMTFVTHWREISAALSDGMNNGKFNWASAARMLKERQVPVSPVQMQRKLKDVLEEVLQVKTVEAVLTMPAQEFADILVERNGGK